MARSTSSVDLFMRALVEGKPWEWDSHTVDRVRARLADSGRFNSSADRMTLSTGRVQPWMPNAELAQRKLRVCVIRDDGSARNHPPVARGLEEVAAALVAAGHEGWLP